MISARAFDRIRMIKVMREVREIELLRKSRNINDYPTYRQMGNPPGGWVYLNPETKQYELISDEERERNDELLLIGYNPT